MPGGVDPVSWSPSRCGKDETMRKTRPPYDPEFRSQMLEMVREGKQPAELAREFGLTARTSGSG